MFDLIIIGGGAAGFYGALQLAQREPRLKITILEKGRNVLSKVKISGGGRCNVTNVVSDPHELVEYYPRGGQELLGPFHSHSSRDTALFFESHGIRLKSETDGRIFPVSDSSQTIIDFFLDESARTGIKILRNTRVLDIHPPNENTDDYGGKWRITTKTKDLHSRYVLVASGGNSRIWNMLSRLGYLVVQPVPSLFSFNIKDKRIDGLQGISTNARITILERRLSSKEITVGLRSRSKSGKKLKAEGPLLVTHWGLSGPAILKLSAWGARELFDYGYKFRILVNWVPEYHEKSIVQLLQKIKNVEGKKTVFRTNALEIPKKLWGRLVLASGITKDLTWAHLSNSNIEKLAQSLSASEFEVDGKSTFKEEFVTAGGVDLKQINFKTFGSKLHPGIYFAGEVLNIDGITGGFNFQSAWTASYIAANAIASDAQKETE